VGGHRQDLLMMLQLFLLPAVPDMLFFFLPVSLALL